MSAEDGRDDSRRVVTGRDQKSGAARHFVMQEINGRVAVKTVGPDPVYLDPQAMSKTIQHMRELQARAMRGVQWEI
jgi:hypothetical protein